MNKIWLERRLKKVSTRQQDHRDPIQPPLDVYNQKPK